MSTLRFTKSKQVESFLVKKGTVATVPYDDGETVKVLAPVRLVDGDEFDVDDEQADWFLESFPDNFAAA